MPKSNQNRAYKRGAPHRDARLFIIVAEGEREDAYFNWFNERNQRIRVQIVPRAGNASAPKHFIRRLEKYLEEVDGKPDDNDSVWFVLDVDRWLRTEIDDLMAISNANPFWNVAISNPCFEVWLHCHVHLPDPDTTDCGALKTALNNLFTGGYRPDKACPHLERAIDHAKELDSHPEQHYPDVLQTKVYRLAEQMLRLLGAGFN